MAENKKSVLLYCDIIHTVEELSDEEAGKLFKHYLRYINDLDPVEPDKLTKIVFEPIKQDLKRDLRKWELKCEKNSEIAKEGWVKRKDANACERIKPDAKHADKDKATDNDKDNATKQQVVEFLRRAAPVSIQQAQIEEEADELLKQYSGKRIKNLQALCNKWMQNVQEAVVIPMTEQKPKTLSSFI